MSLILMLFWDLNAIYKTHWYVPCQLWRQSCILCVSLTIVLSDVSVLTFSTGLVLYLVELMCVELFGYGWFTAVINITSIWSNIRILLCNDWWLSYSDIFNFQILYGTFAECVQKACIPDEFHPKIYNHYVVMFLWIFEKIICGILLHIDTSTPVFIL